MNLANCSNVITGRSWISSNRPSPLAMNTESRNKLRNCLILRGLKLNTGATISVAVKTASPSRSSIDLYRSSVYRNRIQFSNFRINYIGIQLVSSIGWTCKTHASHPNKGSDIDQSRLRESVLNLYELFKETVSKSQLIGRRSIFTFVDILQDWRVLRGDTGSNFLDPCL